MADTAPIVHIGENSPEQIAFKLFMFINGGEANRDRADVLDLYAECLDVVRDPVSRLREKKKR